MKVVGLDLSLTGAGVAHSFRGSDGLPYTTVKQHGTKATTTDLPARSLRLRGLATAIIGDCVGADLVLVEDMFIPTRTTAGAVLDRCGLWWLTVASLTSRGIPVIAVANNHMKQYTLGKGAGKGTDKDYMLAAVVRRYPTVDVQSNNTADALILASMGMRYLGCPLEDSLPESHLRALAAIKWPETITRQEGTAWPRSARSLYLARPDQYGQEAFETSDDEPKVEDTARELDSMVEEGPDGEPVGVWSGDDTAPVPAVPETAAEPENVAGCPHPGCILPEEHDGDHVPHPDAASTPAAFSNA